MSFKYKIQQESLLTFFRCCNHWKITPWLALPQKKYSFSKKNKVSLVLLWIPKAKITYKKHKETIHKLIVLIVSQFKLQRIILLRMLIYIKSQSKMNIMFAHVAENTITKLMHIAICEKSTKGQRESDFCFVSVIKNFNSAQLMI